MFFLYKVERIVYFYILAEITRIGGYVLQSWSVSGYVATHALIAVYISDDY